MFIKNSLAFARIGLGICYDVRFPELAAVSARKGAQVCIYPGAFNTTTGPLHWELLQRARYGQKFLDTEQDTEPECACRAVDNQIYFAMCSPARDLTAGYHAVSLYHVFVYSLMMISLEFSGDTRWLWTLCKSASKGMNDVLMACRPQPGAKSLPRQNTRKTSCTHISVRFSI